MRALVLSLLILSATGCQSLMDGAKEDFSRAFTCPKQGVEARERKDITAYQLRTPKPPSPSAEIAADPARLKMWEEQQQKIRDFENSHSVVEVRGCGHARLYTCGRSSRGSSHSWICLGHDYPDGVAKW
jgi:hypothetical protein